MKRSRERLDITTTRLFPSGAWECSAVTGGRLFRKTYYGYTKREAIALFREHVRTSTP